MIKRLSLAFLLLIVVSSAKAQFDTSFIKMNIRRCADSLTDGFRAQNWDQFTRYSYPALVASLGGRKEFTNYIAQMFGQIPPAAWKKYEPGKILQVIRTGGDYQAIIELKTVIEWQGNRISSTSHLIGESWDGGQFWSFFDSQGDVIAAKMIKPDLSELLIVPKREEKREVLTGTEKPKGQ